MSGYTARVNRRGFTLIEMLVVITIIAILSLIVIPRVQGAVVKAREATLKANLHQLRGAIGQFEADTGKYPLVLDDLVAPQGSDTTMAGTTRVPPGSYKGPYLVPSGGIAGKGVPINPFGLTGATATASLHWDYDSGNGIVKYKGPDGITADGDYYTDL